MRDLVIGDLHGFYHGFMQALERAKYDPANDRLIHIGDIVDGFLHSVEIFDFFLQVENKILIRGNHDFYALQYFSDPTHTTERYWYKLGGFSTLEELKSKNILPGDEKFENYSTLLQSQINYYENDKNQLFVHGGIGQYPRAGKVVDESDYYLDRTMWRSAFRNTQAQFFQNDYDHIFIGHTTVFSLVDKKPQSPDATPILRRNIWNLDTGAGWGGKVTVMDAATKEYWQSDFAPFSAR